MSVQIVRFRTDPQRVPEIAEAGAFRARIAEWAGGPVPPASLHVLGRYHG